MLLLLEKEKKKNVPHPCEKFLLATTFARGVPHGVRCAYGTGIVRALWTVFDRVCIVAACTADRTRISSTIKNIILLYAYERKILNVKKKGNQFLVSRVVKLSAGEDFNRKKDNEIMKRCRFCFFTSSIK